MKFNGFLSMYTPTSEITDARLGANERVGGELSWFLDEFGGKTFNRGIYRVLRSCQIEHVTSLLEKLFPEYRGRLYPFAFDWLGRCFVVDQARVRCGSFLILMLEVGAGEAMEIPADIVGFHNTELVEYPDDVLAKRFWDRWLALQEGGYELSPADCVGYKIPLFLGGEDDVDNLEVVDWEFYVEVCALLRAKSISLTEGESIASFRFKW